MAAAAQHGGGGGEVSALMWKEWRQLLRSRGAMATALILPVLVQVVIPVVQILALRDALANGVHGSLPQGVSLPGGLRGFDRDPAVLVRTLLPLFIAMGGLVVPSVTASYTLIAERESRTLELLAALPVRIEQVLWAKLGVIVLLAAGVTVTLFGVDAVLILRYGVGSLGYVAALLALLVGSLSYSAASALLISLIARDFRTANNLTGALIGPTILLSAVFLVLVPGDAVRVLALAGLFALLALVAATIAVKTVTFERLLR